MTGLATHNFNWQKPKDLDQGLNDNRYSTGYSCYTYMVINREAQSDSSDSHTKGSNTTCSLNSEHYSDSKFYVTMAYTTVKHSPEAAGLDV
jgi:hypothetical protein